MDNGMDTSETIQNETMNRQPIIQVEKMLMMRKKNAASKPQHVVSEMEESLNPQLNQQLKKQLKSQQKKARKMNGDHGGTDLIEEDDDMMQDEPVQFTNLMSAPIPDEDEEL
jgi:hypothetical protein